MKYTLVRFDSESTSFANEYAIQETDYDGKLIGIYNFDGETLVSPYSVVESVWSAVIDLPASGEEAFWEAVVQSQEHLAKIRDKKLMPDAVHGNDIETFYTDVFGRIWLVQSPDLVNHETPFREISELPSDVEELNPLAHDELLTDALLAAIYRSFPDWYVERVSEAAQKSANEVISQFGADADFEKLLQKSDWSWTAYAEAKEQWSTLEFDTEFIDPRTWGLWRSVFDGYIEKETGIKLR